MRASVCAFGAFNGCGPSLRADQCHRAPAPLQAATGLRLDGHGLRSSSHRPRSPPAQAHANEPESHATHMTSQLSRWGKDNGAQAWLVSSLLSWCWLSAALCGYVRGHRQGHIEGCLSFSACSHHGSEVPFGTHLLRCLCCGFGRCALDHLRAFGGGLVGWWLACQWVVMNVDRACLETKALAPSHRP